MKTEYQVLLYYKYVTIADPEAMRELQRQKCEELGLLGRIIVAGEGINGTVEGEYAATEKYIEWMNSQPQFAGIVYKKSPGNGAAFPKLSVRVRPEIVTGRMPEIDPNQISGKYLSSEELHQWFEEKRRFVIVDMRNDYEQESGYFENSVLPGMHNFYDLPKVLPVLDNLRDEVIVTVCTGGVRCEKASGFLVANGFKEVYQLKDGIYTYMEKYPNQHFKGKLYVFDKRLTVAFNVDDPAHEIVGKCYHCHQPADTYVNCEYDLCHYHYICCDKCRDVETGMAFCKPECKQIYQQLMQVKRDTAAASAS